MRRQSKTFKKYKHNKKANKRALLSNNVFASSADPNYDIASDLADVTKAMKANESISTPNAAPKVREMMTAGIDLPLNGEIVKVPVPKGIMEDVINTAGSTGLTGLGQLGWLDSNDDVDLEKAVRDLMLSDKYKDDFGRLQQYKTNDSLLRAQLTNSYNGSGTAAKNAADIQRQIMEGEKILRDTAIQRDRAVKTTNKQLQDTYKFPGRFGNN